MYHSGEEGIFVVLTAAARRHPGPLVLLQTMMTSNDKLPDIFKTWCEEADSKKRALLRGGSMSSSPVMAIVRERTMSFG